MKAYLTEKAGPADDLKIQTNIDKPSIAADQVLIETKAISINPVDYKVRGNDDIMTFILQTEDRPVILGWDVAGTVAEVGSDVSSFANGDRVFGMVNFLGEGKAYAEYVAAPANQMAKIPDSMSFEDAAATTLFALTALQALLPRVKPGDVVLIHAGSGGVGHFAIQIAKSLGATVITTSSAKNKDFCMSLGADEHVDYRAHKFEDVVSNVDVCLDGMGGDTLERSLKVLKDGGKLVTLPTGDFPESVTKYAEEHNIAVDWIMVQSSGDDMRTLSEMVKKGQLKPFVSKTFTFEEMAEAHKQLESGRTVGKVVVKVE